MKRRIVVRELGAEADHIHLHRPLFYWGAMEWTKNEPFRARLWMRQRGFASGIGAVTLPVTVGVGVPVITSLPLV